VTPVVEFLVEPIGTNLTLNCSINGGGPVGWVVALPGEDSGRSGTDPIRPLPPNMMAVDGPGFQQLHITATLETNGSVIRCVFVGDSLQSSNFITAVFYGQLPQNTHGQG
jgi:hypothetical protein